MTDFLLILILIAVIVKIVIDKRNIQRIITLYDSLAEMQGDMIRELINKIEGKK